MKKQEIDSILLANWYLTKCQIESPSSDRTELARKYLVTKIDKVLTDRKRFTQSNPVKAFLFLTQVF